MFPDGDQSFPKRRRLRSRAEFLAVQRVGRRVHARHFVVLVAPPTVAGAVRESISASDASRVGITVSKKVGGAVVRNRIKRWVREHVRTSEWSPSERDVVIIAKSSAATLASLDDVRADLESVRRRLR